ncbi:MAG: hypothetical protein NWE92_01725 [Candidatus Bathyarchaeota archaeon]|nr:hypothetical protein [Candidatus Bathyarchaeota archaeon]
MLDDRNTYCPIEGLMQSERIIKIDATPDLNKYKPIVILSPKEFTKLIHLLDSMKTSWLAMKFNNNIFLFWGELVFLHTLCYHGEDKKKPVQKFSHTLRS